MKNDAVVCAYIFVVVVVVAVVVVDIHPATLTLVFIVFAKNILREPKECTIFGISFPTHRQNHEAEQLAIIITYGMKANLQIIRSTRNNRSGLWALRGTWTLYQAKEAWIRQQSILRFSCLTWTVLNKTSVYLPLSSSPWDGVANPFRCNSRSTRQVATYKCFDFWPRGLFNGFYSQWSTLSNSSDGWSFDLITVYHFQAMLSHAHAYAVFVCDKWSVCLFAIIERTV